MQPTRSAAVERAVAWYRERLFWPVEVVWDEVFLPLGRGIVALDIPADRAQRVQQLLERNDIYTAALFVDGQFPRVTFLAEADDSVFGQFQMPPGVRYLTVPAALRLPLLTALPSDDRNWFRTPDPARRWFPRASAILAAMIVATPYALRCVQYSGAAVQARTRFIG